MTQSDRDRIEKAAKDKFGYGDTPAVALLRDTEIISRSAEAAHWQPIVEAKDAEIKELNLRLSVRFATISSQAEAIAELVERLEALNTELDKYWNGNKFDAQVKAICNQQKASLKLISKHKKPWVTLNWNS